MIIMNPEIPNTDSQRNPEPPNPETRRNYEYDIRENSFQFGLNIVKFLVKIDRSIMPQEIKSQLIRSGTSIGANIEEADDASSRKDYANKLRISRREAKETKYWLRIIKEANLMQSEQSLKTVNCLMEEVDRIIRILSAILKKF